MPIRRGRFAPQNTFLETIAQKFDRGNSNFVLGSAQEKNNYPIVYCSDGFCELTGFSRSELMRRSCACNFLYGLESNQEDLQNIQNALKTLKELKKEVLFYKKNGSPFWCLLDIIPIKNEKGNVVLFLVSHKDVTKGKLSGEVQDDEQSTAQGSKLDPERKLTRSSSRKFSRDVLLHLSRQYQQNGNPSQARRPIKRSRSFSFTSERLPQYKRESTKKSKLLFLHYSNAKGLWDWWVLILTFYIAIMVPYNVAFSRGGKAKDLIIVDMVTELFFILDIVVHFRTTYVNNNGRIVYDQKAIAIHYLKGWFILDFLAALPFEALYYINETSGFLVQLLKCGRLLRLFRVVRKLHRYTEYSTVLLTLLMLAFAMVAHWLACIWYVIGLEEVSAKSTISWLYQFGETIHMPYVNFSAETGPDEGSAYVTALYFTLTSMTTVGFGNVSANTNAEKVFSVIVMLIGALMHAAIFGNVAAIIQKLYANRVRYHSRANEIKQFIRVHHIETDLANRLEDYFHTTWSLSGGVDTREILTTFPQELQADVCMHLYKGLLELSVFTQAPRGLFRMLSLQVRLVYIGPGEYLLTQNDVVNSVYYIASGSMEVLQGESVAAILGKGDLFGEDISRKTPIRRSNGDVRALTYCDVYYITRDRLQEVLQLYPDFAYKFSDKLELTYDLGASERDIWRRGGLDSISEDEEEGDEDDESPGTEPENANSPIGPLPSHRRANHFRASEPWRMYSRPHVQRPNRLDLNERQPLLSPEEGPLFKSGVNVLQPQSREISIECKTDAPTESGLAPERVLSDPSLEWEQEDFTLKNESDSVDHNINGMSNEMDEPAMLEKTDMGAESLAQAYQNPAELDSSLASRLDKESFLQQLRLSTDDAELGDELHSINISLRNSKYIVNDSIAAEGEEIQQEEDKVAHANQDLIGFTEFSTPVHSPRLGVRRQFTGSSARSSPCSFLSQGRCPSQAGSSHGGSQRDCTDSTSIGSLLGTLRKDSRDSLPTDQMMEVTQETLTTTRSESPVDCCRDGFDESPHLSSPREGYGRSKSPGLGSPCVSIRRLFIRTPPPHSPIDSTNREFTDFSNSVSHLQDNTENLAGTQQRSPRSPVRRGFTVGCSPVSSCDVLNEVKEMPAPPSRRRKMSAVVPPPSIFASLVAQASSPYADFVPPSTVRESSITCDCSEKESCKACRDTYNGVLSSSEELRDGLEAKSPKDGDGQSVLRDQNDSPGIIRSINASPGASQDSNEHHQPSSRDGADSCSSIHDSNETRKGERDGELRDNTDLGICKCECTSNKDESRDNITLLRHGLRAQTDDGAAADVFRGESDRLTLTQDGARYQASTDAPASLEDEVEQLSSTSHNEADFDYRAMLDSSPSVRASNDSLNRFHKTCSSSNRTSKHFDDERPEGGYVPPFFDEVGNIKGIDDNSNPLLYEDNVTNPYTHEHRAYSQSQLSLSFSPVTSIHSHKRQSTCTKSSQRMSKISFDNLSTDELPQRYKESINSHPIRKPTLSGIHSMYSLQTLPGNDEVVGSSTARPMRNSFSEPHLYARYFDHDQRGQNDADREDLSDLQLEDIFKDVVSTKQAMERLQTILNSPEPDLCSEMADTKETVKKLDRQVVHLNEDVASLSADVKKVLELLKGLKNGQVESKFQ